jgi:hypothetical protein
MVKDGSTASEFSNFWRDFELLFAQVKKRSTEGLNYC